MANTKSRSVSKQLGWALVLLAAALLVLFAFYGLNQKYWLLPPEKKFEASWQADVQLIAGLQQAALFKRVRNIRVRSTDHSPIENWISKIQIPIEKNKDGDLTLDVFLIHQIEGHRYGAIVQYEFIEIKNNNKIGEFARTLWLGIYY